MASNQANEGTSRWRPAWLWLLLAIQVVSAFGALAVAASAIEILIFTRWSASLGPIMVALCGLFAAQAGLLGIGMAWGGGPFLWRAFALVRLILLWTVGVFLASEAITGGEVGFAELAVLFLICFAVGQPFLWLTRWWFGWRLALQDEIATTGAPPDRQFGLRSLLLAMGGIGLVLGVGRWLLEIEGVRALFGADLLFVGLYGAISCCATLSAGVAALARRYWPLGACAGAVFMAAFTLGLHAIAEAALGAKSRQLMWRESVTFGLADYGWLLGSLLLVRLSGYRLVNGKPHSP